MSIGPINGNYSGETELIIVGISVSEQGREMENHTSDALYDHVCNLVEEMEIPLKTHDEFPDRHNRT